MQIGVFVSLLHSNMWWNDVTSTFESKKIKNTLAVHTTEWNNSESQRERVCFE